MYLVDTDVISQARRGRPEAISWLRSVDSRVLHLSAITLGEIMRGAVMKERTDPRFALLLKEWLSRLRQDYADRILPISANVALEWGRIAASRTRGDADGMIAATALVHDLVLVTRNAADFADTGVKLFDPWAL